MLGSGLDTFPYRQPPWADALRIFEVDRSASQLFKRERLALAGIELPPNVELISCDFETASIRDCLRRSGFDFGKPAFISWLGVTAYLSTEAIEAVFRFVSSLPKTSELIFTFASPPYGRSPLLAAITAAHGEPMRTRFEPNDLAQRLHSLGFSSVTFLSASEADALYFRGRHDGLHARRSVGIVTAQT
jgi:methyltransferase (TIGR00027 family)